MRLWMAAVMVLHATTAPCSSREQVSEAPGTGAQSARTLTATLNDLRDAALADGYAYRQLAYLADNIGPRPSGSPQAEAAAEYVAKQLRDLGLEVRLENVMVPRWVRGQERGELLEYPGRVPGTTRSVALTGLSGNQPTPPEGVEAEVVVARDFTELSSLGRERVAGKIVLFDVRFSRLEAANGMALAAYKRIAVYRSQGAERASALGAVAVLVRSIGGIDARLPHTGGSRPAGIPACAVSSEDAGLIARLAGQGTVRMRLVLKSFIGGKVLSHNVLADLPGAIAPDQVVIVSGHLDSWDLGTGATDDAAGVAVAMEVAELLQTRHMRPMRTLRVIAWMDEEISGTGADAYARDQAGALQDHVAAIESDAGASHPLGFRARVSDAALPLLEPVQRVLESLGSGLVTQGEDPGRDLTPLANAGVPSFALMLDMRDYFDYHHSAADTLDKVDPTSLREVAATMTVLGYALADMPETLPRRSIGSSN